MIESSSNPRLRAVHWIILLVLIALGAAVRFYQITKVSQWPDEFWSAVHLATGRGAEIFDLPQGVLITPPPQTMLKGAPAWFHIWTGLSNVVHPPFYFLVLRGWMDVFGDGDLATRSLSAVASLLAVLVLFDTMRRTSGPQAGLLAAALMALSATQIDMSQQTRSYTLLALTGLLACQALVRIEQGGATRGRLAQLALALIATALTHYFSLGALIALTCYAMARLHGADRRKVAGAIAIAAVVTLVAWGPLFWRQREQFAATQGWSLAEGHQPLMPLLRAAELPAYLLYGRLTPPSAWSALALIAYVLPILFIRRSPQRILWWCWVVAIVGQLLIYDVARHSRLLAFDKYTFLASVGLCALYAMPLPARAWWRWLLPYTVLASTIVTTIARLQEGPSEANGDWRGMALAINRLAGPDDPLVFYPDGFWGSPGMSYLAFAHYVRDSHRPVMFLMQPANRQALHELDQYHRIWLIGPNAGEDYLAYLPGWKKTLAKGYFNAETVCGLERIENGQELLFPVSAPSSP